MNMPPRFTLKILLSLLLGLITGVILKFIPIQESVKALLVDDLLNTGGKLFINLLRMLVVPVVFVSLVCGISSLQNIKTLGRIGIKTFFLYVVTTVIALSLGIFFASIFQIGSGADLNVNTNFVIITPPPLKEVVLNLIPSNPVNAMANSNMLQLIIFSLFLGMSMTIAGKSGEACRDIFIHFKWTKKKQI